MSKVLLVFTGGTIAMKADPALDASGSRGVRFAGTLTGPKARIRLMLALGATDDAAAIRGLNDSTFY